MSICNILKSNGHSTVPWSEQHSHDWPFCTLLPPTPFTGRAARLTRYYWGDWNMPSFHEGSRSGDVSSTDAGSIPAPFFDPAPPFLS